MERSSSSDTKNITWSQKVPADTDKPKKKNSHKMSKNTSATNIVYAETEEKPAVERIFIIEQPSDIDKTKNNDLGRRFENSSASNCNIRQGFKRPSR